ncbi:MAG: hypothetical protein N2Z74_02240 [Syntrophales bacterium]|nr:hypothetical protein [Syntrophales bacterium]
MPPTTVVPLDQIHAQTAPDAFSLSEDYLLFPEGGLFPLTLRSTGLIHKGWNGLRSADFIAPGIPMFYSLTLRRLQPDTAGHALRARRTFMEGVLMALAEKTGRRPSMAEQAVDHSLDAAESRLAMGDPAYDTFAAAAYFAPKDLLDHGQEARRIVAATLRARGLIPQTFYYIPEQALLHLQPGGNLIPPFDRTTLMIEDVIPLMPLPSRNIPVPGDAVWIGMHEHDGRDVYYSFLYGLDPTAEQPPHATTLILGEMGSGKTTLMRLILTQRLLQGRTVITLDPEGENSRLCQHLGGINLPMRIPDDPDTCLLHPLEAQTPADMLMAAQFVLGALRSPLVPEEIAVLHDAVQKRWQHRPGKMSLADLREALATSADPNAISLVSTLRIYAAGGILDGLFDRPKALISLSLLNTLDHPRWINFDLSTLREENRNVVYFMLAWFIYHAVTHGSQPFDVFIDEGWRLMGRRGVFSDMLDELGRRARKRGIGVTLVTHLPGDLSANPSSLSLASTTFVGRLGLDEAYGFLRSIGIPESEAKSRAETITALPPRVFLASPAGRRSALFPVRVIVPDAWLRVWNYYKNR